MAYISREHDIHIWGLQGSAPVHVEELVAPVVEDHFPAAQAKQHTQNKNKNVHVALLPADHAPATQATQRVSTRGTDLEAWHEADT